MTETPGERRRRLIKEALMATDICSLADVIQAVMDALTVDFEKADRYEDLCD